MSKVSKQPSGSVKRPSTEEKRILPWIIAVSSTCFVVVTLCVLGEVSTAWRYARLQNSLLADFSGNTPVAFILGNTRYQTLFSSPANISRYYMPIASFIEQEEYERAGRLLKNTPFAKTSAARDLQNAITAMNEADLEQARLEEEIKKLDAEEAKQSIAYDQLQLQLAQLLHFNRPEAAPEVSTDEVDEIEEKTLPTAASEQTTESDEVSAEESLEGEDIEETAVAPSPIDNEESEYAFYESGLLANLPVLEGIPDNITEPKQLALYVHGNVTSENADGLPFTAEQLSELQAQCGELRQSIVRAEEMGEDLHEQLNAAKDKVGKSSTRAREIFSKLLLQHPSSNLNLFTIQTYEQFQALVQQLGFEVPKLWV